MEYVLVDARQRLIGTMRQAEPLSVGDMFTTDTQLTYAVLNVDRAARGRDDVHTVTVVKLHNRPGRAPAAAQGELQA
jgi:hypothetical protein